MYQMSTENLSYDIDCVHETELIEGSSVCVLCGLEIEDKKYNGQEWEDIGNGSVVTTNTSSSRINIRKNTEKNLDSDFKKLRLDLDTDIKNEVEILYKKITNKQTYRGNKRSGIIYACLKYVFTGHKKLTMVCFKLEDIFKFLPETDKNKGMKIIYEKMEYSGISVGTTEDKIKIYMKHFLCDDQDIEQALNIYNICKNNKQIKKSKIQSITAGIINYWRAKYSTSNTSIEKISQEMSVSVATIKKICTIIDKIMIAKNIQL